MLAHPWDCVPGDSMSGYIFAGASIKSITLLLHPNTRRDFALMIVTVFLGAFASATVAAVSISPYLSCSTDDKQCRNTISRVVWFIGLGEMHG